MSRTLAEANTGFSKDFVESYLCLNGKPITGNDQYKGDTNMKDETTDRDPRLKQTILTWDFPTRVTAATNDSTYIEKEEDFISQYCLTGYKSIKYFIPTDKAFEANNNTYDGIAYRYAETLLINAEAKLRCYKRFAANAVSSWPERDSVGTTWPVGKPVQSATT